MTPTRPVENSQALPAGTRIEEFLIERVLGSGGFGITYLARDISLGRLVVIKENLPVQFCFRDPGSLTVSPRHSHGEDMESFLWSLENFSKEAAMLASLDHPGIVKVLRRFEAFGTAYFVMPFVEGKTLDEVARERGANRLGGEEIHRMLEQVLKALSYLHDRGIYHRDIKPGNLLITAAGLPVLIDFGSARQRLSERSMTVVESGGYTPFEQLQTRGNVGPWSDLYALGATLEKVITGESPPKAMDRMRDDPRLPLAERAGISVTYPIALLRGIDKALEVEERKRWQSATDWIAGACEAPVIDLATPPYHRPVRDPVEVRLEPEILDEKRGRRQPVAMALVGLLFLVVSVLVIQAITSGDPADSSVAQGGAGSQTTVPTVGTEAETPAPPVRQALPPLRPEDEALASGPPRVSFETSKGRIVLELNPELAPITTANFLEYVRSGHYDGTVFHRVIDGFMIQGGGFALENGKPTEKATGPGITNESFNGLKNDRGTIAMARTSDPNSATAQFFINVSNNNALNYPSNGGYAVFGKVIEGMDVVDAIKAVPTHTAPLVSRYPGTGQIIESPSDDVPATPVVIRSSIIGSLPRQSPEIDLDQIALEQLPKRVLLKVEVQVIDPASGLKMKVPAGSRVDLVRLQNGFAVVSPGAGTFEGEVQVADTDLLEQLAATPPRIVDRNLDADEPRGGTSSRTQDPPASPTEQFKKADPADVVAVMQESIRTGQIKEFTFEQVLEWKAQGDEAIADRNYQTGVVSYSADTIFGVKPIQAKALIQEGKVVRWIWPKSGMEIE